MINVRQQVASGEMKPLAVIKDFDIFKHGLPGFGTGSIGLVMYQFGFQDVKEAFPNSVIALPTHALPDAVSR